MGDEPAPTQRGLPVIPRLKTSPGWRALRACLLFVWLAALYPGLAAANPEPDLGTIDAFVAAQMQRHGIPGLALGITQGDRILHLRGFGTAGPDRPMTAQTPLHIGSISKSFTAMAVMQLVEAGEIDLDAPVRAYLPWFRVAKEQDLAMGQIRTGVHLGSPPLGA
jgi:CubicO group peptidase (beta-lactamase class C family)